MLKKLLTLVLLFTLAATAAGCGAQKTPDDRTSPESVPATAPATVSAAEPSTDVPAPENAMPVVDQNGAKLGIIDSRAECSAVDAGIFYSIFALGEYEFTATAEYRLFNKEDKTDVLLGKLEGQGFEASFARTELNGSIYTLAVRGNPGSESVPLLLLAFDPARGTMKTYTVSEKGFPYADMAAVNGKLLILNHETPGMKYDKIYEFDPAGETVREVLSFSSDVDSLRGVCDAGNGFYLLRLKIGSGGENEMFVDLYDKDYGKISEQSVHETMVKAIMTVPGMLSRQDALNEIGMNVTHFSIVDGRYMFYENLSIARVVVDLQTGEALLAKEDLYAVSRGNGSPAVYRMDYDEDVKDAEIVDLEDGKLVNRPFATTDSHNMVRSVSRSSGGTWVVVTSDDYRAFRWTLQVCLWTDPA